MPNIHNPVFKTGSLTEGTHTADFLVKTGGTQEQFLKADGTISIGAFDKNYTHDQGVASAVWAITHPLNKRVSVMVVDSTGSIVVGKIDYIDDSNITITFNAGFSGKAYLN